MDKHKTEEPQNKEQNYSAMYEACTVASEFHSHLYDNNFAIIIAKNCLCIYCKMLYDVNEYLT